MKNKHNGGFSLIETLVAIAVLGIVVVPTCNAMLTSFRLNQAADTMLQSQLAVSSAVETMMAEGISKVYMREPTDENPENYGWTTEIDEKTNTARPIDRFLDVRIEIDDYIANCADCQCSMVNPCFTDDTACSTCSATGTCACIAEPVYYKVVATSTENESVKVTTHIRATDSEAPPKPEGGNIS